MAEINSKGIIKPVENLFSKLPPLPKSANEFIVSIAPWVALILGIIGIIGSLSAFGLSTVFSPLVLLGGGVTAATGLIVVSVIGLIASVLMVVAVPSLLKKKAIGWTFLFWSEMLGILSAIISLSLGSLIFPLIWLYVLFQIKPYYK
ncbi:MAG: hypothetical protein M1524_03930 [Patescibacteria group bacterium]|nr:hypothetical protein [Patescibacteria group bacterium]